MSSVILNQLSHLMLTNENIDKFLNSSNSNTDELEFPQSVSIPKSRIKQTINKDTQSHNKVKNVSMPLKNTNVDKSSFYNINKKDTLFWCYYILKYGQTKYEMDVGNQFFSIEKKEKFDAIEKIRKNKDVLKQHKIKPLNELESELGTGDIINMKTFIALCILENINILLINNKKIYELKLNDSPPYVIHKNKNSKIYFLELECSHEKIEIYRTTYYNMNNYEPNLKSLSSYKLEELQDICRRLSIDLSIKEGKKKLLKKDLYELIVMNLS
jgi:hypothetical protein